MTTTPAASPHPAQRPAPVPTARSPWLRLRRRLPSFLVILFLTFIAIISLFPLYWLFVTALTPASATVKMPPQLFPTNPTLENFSNIMRLSGVGKLQIGNVLITMPRMSLWFLNTVALALISTGIHVLFDTMAGYAFAKRKFPGSNVLFWLVLAALMIPAQVTLVPLYLMITQLKLVNTFWGVLLPGLADVIGIFLLKQYIQTLPNELIEAARIDGASEWQIFTRIIVPLAAPAWP